MYSGKTSKLLAISCQLDRARIRNVIINHISDTRYGDGQELVSHDGTAKPCVSTPSLHAFHDPTKALDTEAILINEGQFFDDIVVWVTKMVKSPHSKQIYICGLDADFRGHSFGSWLELLPIADNISKLQSVCAVCKKKPSVFSMRLCSEERQVLVGNTEYVPACRACFEHKDAK